MDVYGKFIYMTQFSANFPVENDKCLVPLPLFQKYFIEIVQTVALSCYPCLPRAALKIVSVYIHGKERIVNCMWGFFALNECPHQHHDVIQKLLSLM